MMDKTAPNKHVIQIAARIRELRQILEISKEEMAEKLGLTLEGYTQYEQGEEDIPIGVIYGAAAVMGIDSTALLTGENARMADYTVVRNGFGVSI